MNLEQLNFHHLFYFWRVAKMGHLTRAAQTLHVSQSALSAQIKQLEDRLGETCSSAKKRRLPLTETGQLVLSYAENIFGLGQEMLGRLQGSSEGMTRLRVGSVATLSRNYQENWIRPLLSDPAVTLTLESGLLHDLLDGLLQHQLDVVLANEPVPSDPSSHCTAAFWAVRPFPGGTGVVVVQTDLGHSARARRARPGSTGPPSRPACAVRRVVPFSRVKPRIRAEVDDMAMLRLIARDSGWLTVVPEVVVQDELKSKLLVKVGESADLKENFYAITTPHRYRIERLERLLKGACLALRLKRRRPERLGTALKSTRALGPPPHGSRHHGCDRRA